MESQLIQSLDFPKAQLLSLNSPSDEQPDESSDGRLFSGLRRGFKRFGSVSHGRLPPLQTNWTSSVTPAESHLSTSQSTTSLADQARNQNWTPVDVQKPLPEPPSITKEKPVQAPEHTTPTKRPQASGTLIRDEQQESSLANPQAQSLQSSIVHASKGTASMSSTQAASSSATRHDVENARDAILSRSNGASATPQPSTQARASPAVGTPRTSSTHLSGLMCNVHRTTGKEPHPLVGASTTILGDKLYVFGGRVLSRTKPALTSDLFELDLIKRHWTKIEPKGDLPPPRYFHSVCPLGDTKLVCYGGMSPATNQAQAQAQQMTSYHGADAQPEVVVMSDIFIYDAPTQTWTFVPTTDTPQGRYAHCATILPSSATFSSPNAPNAALHHNPSGPMPNSGTIGINIDGTGGAEMVIVGGQDSANHYIEQISVFNLRSLRWTSTQQLGKSCGAYRSVVAPISSALSAQLGKGSSSAATESKESASSMLIYSNYNFLDVKLELQVRLSDGTLTEKPMQGTFSPPGLRFPNGGVIDTNFVVSGTYLTSSKQEYALWALDLRSLTWSRIDAGGDVFSQGSWNRGVLWNRRNTFVILGNRKRSLVEDYNHRRINFANVCMVELEAFGLYDNPRHVAPMSGFVSASSPFKSLTEPGDVSGWNPAGRRLMKTAEELGQVALSLRELADMDILCIGGERIPVNSRLITRRWGPYFIQLLREGAASQQHDSAAAHSDPFVTNPARHSSITITPNQGAPSALTNGTNASSDPSSQNPHAPELPPDVSSMPPSSRPRTLYLPHTHLTIQALLHFLYMSSLPPNSSSLCTPQILCSLLQIARPYRIDGLLEAVVQRLHHVLDSRNAAAVFNASAMAAGGGRTASTTSSATDAWHSTNNHEGTNGLGSGRTGSIGEQSIVIGALSSDIPISLGSSASDSTARKQGDQAGSGLRLNTEVGNLSTGLGGRKKDDDDSMSATSMSSMSSEISGSDLSSAVVSDAEGPPGQRRSREKRSVEAWSGDTSAVIGLQKRGLRGLMEGRRLRERGLSFQTGSAGGAPGPSASAGVTASAAGRVGLGISGT